MSIGRLKLQYVLNYAVNGCLIPFIPIYFRQLNLNEQQMGTIMAVASFAIVLSPLLATFLADAHLQARRILAGLFILTALALTVLPVFDTYFTVLIGFALLSIVQVPLIPLQDGIAFASQAKMLGAGSKPPAFHKIRVWGTIGFIIPGLLLYLLVSRWENVTVVLYLAGGFALLAGINAFRLEDVNPSSGEDKLPTAAAARVLFSRHLLGFTAACFLLQMASAAYYTFYPVYLSQTVGLPRSSAGMIMNIGVIIEILFMLGCGRLQRRFGDQKLLVLGSGIVGLRMLLLAAFPIPAIAIGNQVLHGMTVLTVHLLPIMLINRLAGDRFRHSMQGLFAMVVIGGGRILGNFLLGPIARESYAAAYWTAAAFAAVAMLLLALTPIPRATTT